MIYAFGPYELDTVCLELRRTSEVVPVEPQVFDVLAHLVRNRDRVVTRRELLESIWGHRFVADATLGSRLMAARRAVGDDGRVQSVIRTLHGRGYRFVAPVEERAPDSPPRPSSIEIPHTNGASAPSVEDAREGRTASIGFVVEAEPDAVVERLAEREREMEALEALLQRAVRGTRGVAFVSGEAGIGKTTLVERFLAGVRARGAARTAQGQCLDQRGAGEPYLPVLEALGRLCRGPGGAAFVALLDREAPTWLAQMPGVVGPEALVSLQERTRGATRERMLRELVEALEAWTAGEPLVLALEDLHWSDPSTLHLVDALARRREDARLLVVATFRPAEVRVGGHPLQTLVQELRVRRLCADLTLSPLTESGVADTLALRFPGGAIPAGLPRLLHARTEGNPLFVGALLGAWTARGALDGNGAGVDLAGLARDVPDDLRHLIQQQVERLAAEDQAVLEAASVAGMEFSAAAVAAALGQGVGEVEERCDYLAREGRFVQPRGTESWPDGTFSGRYALVHHLHRDVLYGRMSGARRARLYRRIGARLEEAYDDGAVARAPELALHFTEGRDPARAVEYRHRAAEQALARSAHPEAVEHLERALAVVRAHPTLPDAAAREAALLRLLAPALVELRGWGDAGAERAFARARELCEVSGDTARLARVLYGLAYVHEIRGDYARSQALVEERLRLDLPQGEPGPRIEAYELLACSLFHQGRFARAVAKARAGIRIFRGVPEGVSPDALGEHSGVACHYWAGLALWFLGRSADGAARLDEAVRLAGRARHLYMLAMAHAHVAQLYQLRGEPARVAAPAEQALALAERHGYPYPYAIARAMQGWARVMEGRAEDGLARIREGLDAERAIGAGMERPYFLGVLADALAAAGRLDEAGAVVDEALAAIGGKGRAFFWEAELRRVRGMLLLRRGERVPGLESLRAAREVARRQGARALELRAALALFHAAPGDEEARRALTLLSAGLAPDDDAPDLREARQVLAAPAKEILTQS
ncbi:MAG TPA: AAA family ATPase [Longimicrobium sp.]|nr:AAA family ATPase [Longimicrobium sp.]